MTERKVLFQISKEDEKRLEMKLVDVWGINYGWLKSHMEEGDISITVSWFSGGKALKNILHYDISDYESHNETK